MNYIQPVILCGGNGTRLWPLSRELFPKQFLNINASESMLQRTLSRLEGLPVEAPILICNEKHRFITAEQIRATNRKPESIILEPFGRNTAPAIALAALKNIEDAKDPLMLILAADHVFNDETSFRRAIMSACYYAESDKLVTFGIVPTKPETGYGYIKRGDSVNTCASYLAFNVSAFVEKPDIEKAATYVSSQEYYWNSGMFLFKASKYIEELKKFRPDIIEACTKALALSHADLDFIRIDQQSFQTCPSDSIDYAVMEKTSDAIVVPMDAGWSDVGSWSSVWDVAVKNIENNVINGDVVALDTVNSYLHADGCLLTTIGINDLVIVCTKDAVLVAERSASQNVKNIVDTLKRNGRYEHQKHREVYRPWGKYDSIDSSERYQVKRITVKPGEGLSLQMHYHRAEHWIVVAGTARVTINDEVRLLGENESIYIPIGAKHCLENPGKIALELIEVRSGAYLEEDDIIRFADKYGRV
ncbi:mannose-1-phosphate guanylyltransferase/mannose-6-phosphate isomerase [Salmonella enterica]|uniref:mannose-1-phosphate guanylyltransferase/mannose-6-phosphate isomerase n=1 Tax=Salmonella enterica TaxID=28901 RepID=UPI00370B1E35